MGFSLGLAFGIAGTTISVLLAMGLANRRSGWTRTPNRDILELLAALGEINSGVGVPAAPAPAPPAPAASAPAPAPAPQAAPVSMGLQLTALHQALQPGPGAPQLTPGARLAEEEVSPKEMLAPPGK